MGVINVESLLKPISADSTCGENLRWDRRFLELERLAEGKEETQFSASEEPNWREVRDVCVEVFARGKHVRTALLLTLAALRIVATPIGGGLFQINGGGLTKDVPLTLLARHHDERAREARRIVARHRV